MSTEPGATAESREGLIYSKFRLIISSISRVLSANCLKSGINQTFPRVNPGFILIERTRMIVIREGP